MLPSTTVATTVLVPCVCTAEGLAWTEIAAAVLTGATKFTAVCALATVTPDWTAVAEIVAAPAVVEYTVTGAPIAPTVMATEDGLTVPRLAEKFTVPVWPTPDAVQVTVTGTAFAWPTGIVALAAGAVIVNAWLLTDTCCVADIAPAYAFAVTVSVPALVAVSTKVAVPCDPVVTDAGARVLPLADANVIAWPTIPVPPESVSVAV